MWKGISGGGGVSLQSGAKILVLSGVLLLALFQEITRQGR